MQGEARRRALLVGINCYPPPIAPLHGCVNDCRALEQLLGARVGFDAHAIRLLLDADATRAAILDGLEWLVGGAQAGDLLVFAYSGHGSQVPDDGDDEWECRDEILVPVDHRWENPLRDDDLRRVLDKAPPAAQVVFFCDSCHSGTADKETTPTQTPRVLFVPAALKRAIAEKVARRNEEMRAFTRAEVARLRSEVPPAELEGALDRLLRFGVESFKQNRYRFVERREHNILLAACQDVETSTDAFIEGDWHGAFTFHLVRALEEGGPYLTWAALVAQIGAGVAPYGQTPQLECRPEQRDLPVFTTATA